MSATMTNPAVTLSDEQQAAVDHLLDHVKVEQVQTLGGYAGTGKSVVASHLAAALPDFAVCAFTGKAADILRRKGLQAATIHSTIYRPETDLLTRKVKFVLKPEYALGYAGFIIDEASMVAGPLFRDLKSYGKPIIAIGDHGQLPPVGDDAGLMKSPDIRLETIHRNAGSIARFAEHVRKGGDVSTWPEDRPALWVIEQKNMTPEKLMKADQVICALNRTRIGLNRTIRKMLGRPDPDRPEVGDRVICLRNDRSAGVFNGQQGVIVSIDHRRRDMNFKPTYGETICVNYHPDGWNAPKAPEYERGNSPGERIPFDFAYCVTCHKFQGDEANKVVVYEEHVPLWEHARWAYTAASRCKEVLVWAI